MHPKRMIGLSSQTMIKMPKQIGVLFRILVQMAVPIIMTSFPVLKMLARMLRLGMLLVVQVKQPLSVSGMLMTVVLAGLSKQ